MHDVGTFVWVVLVVIGVVSSIVSNARRRGSVSPIRDAQPQAIRIGRVSGQPAVGRPVANAAPVSAPAAPVTKVRRPSPPRVAPQSEQGLEAFHPVHRRAPRLFGGRGALARAVIAAEVLGKPLALRDWS